MNKEYWKKFISKFRQIGDFNFNIRIRLFLWSLIVSVVPIFVIGGFSYYLIFEKISKQNEETISNVTKGIYNMVDTQQQVLNRWLESSMASLNSRLISLGQSRLDHGRMVDVNGYRLPTWYIGKQKITGDFTIVDHLMEKESLASSFFQLHNNKFIRVSTNARRVDGSRILYTLLESPGPVYERLINGQPFVGRANVVGVMYATIYHPIRDVYGKLIGAVVIGRKEQEYEVTNAIKNIVIGETGYVFVMDPQGNVIIHPSLQGRNVANLSFIQEILQKKNGFITYDWEGRTKIAHYVYYEPWNWYIVATSYKSEIFNITSELSRMLVFTVILAIGIAILISFILSNTFSKPINQLVQVMRLAQNGNLSAKFHSTDHDEFRILSSAFNTMLDNISLLISRILSNSTKLKEASERLIIDINESKRSLEDMSDNIEKMRNISTSDPDNLFRRDSNKLRHLINGLESTITDLKLDRANVNMEKRVEMLRHVEDLCVEIRACSTGIDFNDGDSTPSAISYFKKINVLEVEVQKLNLLLKNICSSASQLDGIALSLDRNVNVFKIDHSGE